jgi:hypothetical protein
LTNGQPCGIIITERGGETPTEREDNKMLNVNIEELRIEYARHERVLEEAFWADRLAPYERMAVDEAHRRQREIRKIFADLGLKIEE